MFPESLCNSSEVISGLRCYYDDEFGWYHHNETDCDYITNIKKNKIEFGLSISPNPTIDNFTVNIDKNNESHLIIIDFTGKIVYQESFSKETNIISSSFKEGLLFCESYK